MNILLIGSGGREHALAWKIKQSPLARDIYCSPGNGGIAQEVPCLPLDGNQAVLDFCRERAIDLVVIGPEQPLVDGLSDALRKAGVAVFGCSQAAAQLEGSKGFTKDLCARYGIPTAAYGRFTDADAARAYLAEHPAPIVIKADGLAAGKGVIMAETEFEALEAIDEILGGRFGDAGASLVMEEWLDGEEASFFALSDGTDVVAFGTAQDHKRVGEGDNGPNTGGMGTYAPPPLVTDAMVTQVMETIIKPTVSAMKSEGTPFQGILFAGLMVTQDGPQLLEYNVRFGDPETQSLMLRLESDIVPLLHACATGKGLQDAPIRFKPQAAICVVMAAKGYPGSHVKNTEIKKLDQFEDGELLKIFHAGTTERDGRMLATGGRVLGVSALGDTLEQARQRAYAAIDLIDWPEGFCRRDIGWRALAKDAA